MFDQDVTTATHKTVYHIKNPTTYTYFKRHPKGHWLYFTHEPGRRWEASSNRPEWFEENLMPIDKDEFKEETQPNG